MKLLTLFLFLIFSNVHTQVPVSVHVDGMGCGFCVNAIEKKLSQLPEVKNIQVNLTEGLVFFDVIATSQNIDSEKYLHQISLAGYEPRDLKIGDAAQSSILTIQQEKSPATFFVAGNCGMCKKRIEAAARSVKGVRTATWDMKDQQLTVAYNTSKVTLKEIQTKIAAAGHDTAGEKATDADYENLHGCCKYERPEK